MASENEGECTCLPVKLIEDSLLDGISPYGSQSQECFQVDTKFIFRNQTSNGKRLIILTLKVNEYTHFIDTLNESIEEWNLNGILRLNRVRNSITDKI